MQSLEVILAAAAVLVLTVQASDAFPQNYLSGKLGASISTSAKLEKDADPNVLMSDGVISKSGFYFGTVEQEQVFTVDLGQERDIDRVQFGSTGYNEARNAKRLTISVSSNGPDGPFESVLETQKIGTFQILRFPLVKTRWVKFDMGKGTEGTYVHSVRIYRSYEHPKLAEVAKLLQERIKPDIKGLEGFYTAADKGDWTKAASELREYFAATHKPENPPKPDVDLSGPKEYASGNVNFAGIPRQVSIPIDWSYQETRDWYEHKNFINRGRMIGYPLSAYYDTADPKWLDWFRTVFYDWVDANPCPPETIYADQPTWRTLDSAMRLGWLISGFPKAAAARGIEDELWANYLYLIWEHANYLHNDKISAGNWLATVTSAVMDTALDFPEFSDQRAWMEFGKKGFETNVRRDIYPDGKEKEDAPGYVCMAYAGMFRTLKALDEAKISVDPEVLERMNKVLNFLGAITQPNGDTPAIGDWGGGKAYCLPDIWPYFKREDIRYILSQGMEGVMPEKASVHFPDGNWSIMRSPYEEKPYETARHLIFKSSHESHGHLDSLEITAYAYGRPIFIDPGIKSYEREDGARYVQTPYHNTISVDGKNMERGGGQTDKWVSNNGIDFVSGYHDRYPGLIIRRSIAFVKPDYWILRDTITGEGSHSYEQNWHFNEDAGIVEDPATKAVRTGYPDGNLMMIPVDTDSTKSERTTFLIAKERMTGGQKAEVESKGWRYSKSGPAPAVFDMVLYPYSGASAPKVSAKKLTVDSPDMTAIEIRNGDKTDYVLISNTGVRAFSLPDPSISAEGEVVVIRTEKGKPVRVSGSNVKLVSFGGKTVFTREQPSPEVDEIIGK